MTDEVKRKSKEITRSLRSLNRQANRYMKRFRGDRAVWKQGYGYLVKSEIWKRAKQLLIEYNILHSDHFDCIMCQRPVVLQRAVLHHKKYNRKKYFKPSYIAFVHYVCHENAHPSTKGRLLSQCMKYRLTMCALLILFVIVMTFLY